MAIPFIGQTLEELARRQRAYERAQAMLAQQESGIWNQYGLIGQYENGHLTNLGADPNNPTGLYQQMGHAHAGTLSDLQESNRMRGFTGGLLGQQEQDVRYEQGAEQADFMRSLTDNLGGIFAARQDNSAQYEEDKANIWHQALLDAMENGDFTPVKTPAPGPRRRNQRQQRRPAPHWVPGVGWVRGPRRRRR